MDSKLIGHRTMLCRKDLNMSQIELAERVGMSEGWLNRLENGSAVNPQLESIERLAAGLGVNPAYLLGYSDDPLPKVELPAHLNETNVIYELYEVKDKIRLQRLIDNYQALDSSLQDIVLNLATALHDAQIAQMYDR
jgi:transcriptional regulator with XRE-family HTH domain